MLYEVITGLGWTLQLRDDLPYQLVESGASKLLLDPRTGRIRTFDAGGALVKVEDGWVGMAFLATCLKSSRNNFV